MSFWYLFHEICPKMVDAEVIVFTSGGGYCLMAQFVWSTFYII